MKPTFLPLEATHAFSNLFLDYTSEKSTLSPFYQLAPRIENFAEAIKIKESFSALQRKTLVEVLQKQYEGIPNPPHTIIESLLEPKTFTVTTGHQLCLYTGQMYFIYKILTTIRLAEELKKQYPTYNFVPLFWLASEDHDFEEVNHFHLFGQKYTWESTQKGAVGKFETQELNVLFEKMQERMPEWEAIYLKAKNLSEATRKIVHSLFGQYNLICLDSDEAICKQVLQPIMRQDIFEQASYLPVNQTNEALAKLGYKTQVHPREINFFYLRNNFRERIVKTEAGYETTQGTYTFTKEALQEEIAKYPERFSPNVVLRPVYQELLLPNLAYIGGPGELAYWLQFKTMFETYKVPFPILFSRNFGLIIQKTIGKKLTKLGLPAKDLFQPEATLKERIIAQTTGEVLMLEQARQETETAFQSIAIQAEIWDKSLISSIDAEKHKTLKSIDNLEKRLRKAQENKAETELKQLAGVRDKLLPGGELQERYDNYLNFSLNNQSLLPTIYQTLDPFNKELYIWQEEN